MINLYFRIFDGMQINPNNFVLNNIIPYYQNCELTFPISAQYPMGLATKLIGRKNNPQSTILE